MFVLEFIAALADYAYQKARQFFAGLVLHYMVWRHPDEARRVVTRARWQGAREDDVALLRGANIIEELLRRYHPSQPTDVV